MRDVVIDQKGCRLTFDRQVLILHHDRFRRPVMIPFGQIQSLTIVSGVELSSTLLTKLAHHKIAVVILAGIGATSCFVQGKWGAGVARRQAQYDIIRDERSSQYWANTLVRLKNTSSNRFITPLDHQLICSSHPSAQRHQAKTDATKL